MYTALFGQIKQWGFLVKNLDEAMALWVEQLGVGPWWGYRDVTLDAQFVGQVPEQSRASKVTMDVGMAWQNGVQIELVQQTNDAPSPYSFFYQTNQAQFMHQVGYLVDNMETTLAQAKNAGFIEYATMSNEAARVVYLKSPRLNDMVVELMSNSAEYAAFYNACAKEAESWDGSNPYRLVKQGR